jgi:hypothetical protein
MICVQNPQTRGAFRFVLVLQERKSTQNCHRSKLEFDCLAIFHQYKAGNFRVYVQLGLLAFYTCLVLMMCYPRAGLVQLWSHVIHRERLPDQVSICGGAQINQLAVNDCQHVGDMR